MNQTVYYRLDGNSLGIEVATAYFGNLQAKQKWTLDRGKRKFPDQGYELQWGGPITNGSNRMRKQIQKEINKKRAKKYSGVDKCWLCIYETSPTSDERTVRNWLNTLKIPDDHSFDAIYLLHNAPTFEGGMHKAFKVRTK